MSCPRVPNSCSQTSSCPRQHSTSTRVEGPDTCPCPLRRPSDSKTKTSASIYASNPPQSNVGGVATGTVIYGSECQLVPHNVLVRSTGTKRGRTAGGLASRSCLIFQSSTLPSCLSRIHGVNVSMLPDRRKPFFIWQNASTLLVFSNNTDACRWNDPTWLPRNTYFLVLARPLKRRDKVGNIPST